MGSVNRSLVTAYGLTIHQSRFTAFLFDPGALCKKPNRKALQNLTN